jgi:uncharacterized protein YraI
MSFIRILQALCILAAAPAALQAQTALQATGTVNVRSGPGTGYGILGQASAGQTYVGFQQSGDWWRIYWNGGTGWTHRSYYSTPSGTTGVKVTTDTLNVRSGPGTGYGVLGQVYMGQIHFWTQYEGLNGWYKIWWAGRAAYVSGAYVTRVALNGGPAPAPTPTPPPSTLSNLPMTYQRQVTNYFCGPATSQMAIQYLTGRLISQYTIASYSGTSPNTGTSAYNVSRAIGYYSGQAYTTLKGFTRDRAVSNIQRNKPVPINFQCRYLGFWNYRSAMHHSPIKGYTSGGFYIHDSWIGPDRWASSTEVWNAVNYHYGLFSVRY